MTAREDSVALRVRRDGWLLDGESTGSGTPVVLLHGITAMRRYVLHGSRALARAGHRQLSYDARGHGRSDPAPDGQGYAYEELVSDLEAVVDAEIGEEPFVLAGHSMGAHTTVAYALGHQERLAGMVVIGPVYMGSIDHETIARWDRLADGLGSGGVEGFMAAFDQDLDPRWREAVLRITRARMAEHLHPAAVSRALREVPRSAPFEAMSELEFCDLPALVVASHDEADPGHPHAVAVAYADRLPRARLISEEPGSSPLAWQGGRLAREIASFCADPAVASRARDRGPYP